MATMSAAWPHFVPRVELDVELKTLADQLDQVFRRISRVEPCVSAIELKLEEVIDRCGGDSKVGALATQAELAAVEMRIGRQLANEVIEINMELEELRHVVADKATVEGLKTEHSSRLYDLDNSVAELSKGLREISSELQASVEQSRQTFATQADHRQSCEQHTRAAAELAQRAGEAATSLQALEEARVLVAESVAACEGRVGQLECNGQVHEQCIDGLQTDLAGHEKRCWEAFASKTSVQQALSVASEAHTKLDFAMMDRATLRRTMTEEFDMLKKTIFRQQKAFRDMDEAVDCVNEHKQLIKRFREELRRQDKQLEDFAKRLDLQDRNFHQLAAEHQRDVDHLEDVCGSLQRSFNDQVSQCQATAESMSQSSTRISLDQMDKSLALRQSLDKLHEEHEHLRNAVLGDVASSRAGMWASNGKLMKVQCCC
ncbi:unnamed protein product [Symbiodinium sp. CCMP2592]|nr:unnamed protein product [Symbiodinium sp. CCMP2592]